MSRTDFSTFMAKLKDDAALRNALLERFGTGKEIPVQRRVDFATEQGCAFSAEDANEELSDAQLEGVTGGTSTSFISLSQPLKLTLNTSTSSFTLMSSDPHSPGNYLPGDQY